jgi:protein-disulfide isomerase
MASRKEQKEQLRAQRMEAEAADQAKQRRQRLIQYGSGAAFIAICLVAVLIVVSQSGGGGGDTSLEGVAQVNKELAAIPQEGSVLGDKKADTTVVEFGDLQCPVCKAFSEQVAPDLVSSQVKPGKVRYEFRQFAIIGPESDFAAKAALAAGKQGRFWNFTQVFYRNQGIENSGYVTDDFLTSVAQGAGVPDIGQWNKDRADPRLDDVIAKDKAEAEKLGFTGTPSVLVEGPKGNKAVNPGTVPTLQEIEKTIQSVQ